MERSAIAAQGSPAFLFQVSTSASAESLRLRSTGAEGKDVGARIGQQPAHLLRRHVTDRYDTSGNLLKGPVDLNTFYGYAPAINRGVSPLQFGPSIADPSCYYDSDTQRWFHIALTLDRANPFTQGLSGANHIDIAVSKTSSPLGGWVVYHLPVQNDGTQGTPDPRCTPCGRKPATEGRKWRDRLQFSTAGATVSTRGTIRPHG